MPLPHIFPTDLIEKRRALLTAVDQMRDRLAASADDSEARATLAPDAVKALDESGLLRLKLPSELGGAEANLATQLEVIEALATIDTSSAWCAMVGATSIAVPGAFLPGAGIHHLFANDHIPRAAMSVFPSGTMVMDRDGYRLNGRWRFVSAVRHADWVSLATVVKAQDGASDTDGSQDVIFATLPSSEVEIHDNWRALGLKGTGSCDVSVFNAFIPSDLTFCWDRVKPMPQRGGPLYRLPPPGFVANEHTGIALGVARRALDELINQVRNTRGAFRASALHERQVVDRAIGRFDLDLAAARALALEKNRSVWQQTQQGELIDAASHAELRSIAAYVTDLAVNIVTTAYRYGGAGALFQPNILERLLRDIHAAAQHITVGDEAYEAHGKHVIGVVDNC